MDEKSCQNNALPTQTSGSVRGPESVTLDSTCQLPGQVGAAHAETAPAPPLRWKESERARESPGPTAAEPGSVQSCLLSGGLPPEKQVQTFLKLFLIDYGPVGDISLRLTSGE